MADLLPGYTYDKDSQRYRNSDTGRFVSRTKVLGLLDQQVNKVESNLNNLYDLYTKTDMGKGVYVEAVGQELRRAHLQQAALAKGGWDKLTQSDYGRAGQALRQIYPKIRGTADDIDSGKVSEAQVKHRNTAYAGSGRRIYHATEQQNAQPGDGKVMVEQRILDSNAQHCEDCLNYAELGVQPAGRLPVPGEACRCGDNCRCGIRRWEVSRAEYEKIVGKESMTHELQTDALKLVEKAMRPNGTVPIKIIAPGWGSSGYYSSEMLQEQTDKFQAGTQMFWDHPTPDEESERPEGTLRNLAGVLVSDAQWSEAHGPGLYADMKPFSEYADAIEEMAPHIGVSIRAAGVAEMGRAEGRDGRIIKEITGVQSVDFVTTPGAGGQIIEMFEAARDGKPLAKLSEGVGAAIKSILAEQDKTEQQFCDDCELEEHVARGILSGDIDAPTGEQYRRIADYLNVNVGKLQPTRESKTKDNTIMDEKLQEALDQIAQLSEQNKKLQESQQVALAKDKAAEALAESGLPEPTRARLAKQLSAVAPIKEGMLDTEAFDTLIEAAITEAKAEVDAILSESKTSDAPVIRDMGGNGTGTSNQRKDEEIDAQLESAFAALGLSESAAKVAANGRI